MLSQIPINNIKPPSAVVAAQSFLDSLQASITSEAQKVATALSCMAFSTFAVDGPMLTGSWGGAPEHE